MPNNLVLNELKELLKNLDLGERENTNIETLVSMKYNDGELSDEQLLKSLEDE